MVGRDAIVDAALVQLGQGELQQRQPGRLGAGLGHDRRGDALFELDTVALRRTNDRLLQCLRASGGRANVPSATSLADQLLQRPVVQVGTHRHDAADPVRRQRRGARKRSVRRLSASVQHSSNWSTTSTIGPAPSPTACVNNSARIVACVIGRWRSCCSA